MRKEEVRYDCSHFQGHIPCEPNKLHDVQCNNCSHYEYDPSAILNLDSKQSYLNEIYKICNFTSDYAETSHTNIQTEKTKILFIKLGAIGDVIRTTPLLEKFKEQYGACHFTWVTHSPQVVPKNEVDLIFKWNESAISFISEQKFDVAINLDKDKEACMLLSAVHSNKKFGFNWKDGHVNIATEKAEHKLITGFFDHVSKMNTKNYLEEIFEICHFDFNLDEYKINLNQDLSNKWKDKLQNLANGKVIIGLNTGCGLRWKTRLWPAKYWIENWWVIVLMPLISIHISLLCSAKVLSIIQTLLSCLVIQKD